MAEFLSDRNFELFKDLIYNESGITFSVTNRSILESRLKDRLRENKMDDIVDDFTMVVSRSLETL